MMKSFYTRLSATSAIAAAVALTTPAVAQDATATPDPIAVEPSAVPEPAAADQPTEATSEVTEQAKTEPAAAAPAKPARAKAAARAQATRASAPVKTAAASKPATVRAPAVEPVAASQVAPALPVTDPVEPAAVAPVATAQADQSDETAFAVGGGALALLLVGGAAVAMRRRSNAVEAWEDEPIILTEHEAVEIAPAEPVSPKHDPVFRQSGYIAPPLSAFSWGNATHASVKSHPLPRNVATLDDGSDRRAGESWVERAYRGPSPANPSVSLKNRLRRAAFFDKREREVAAGTAEPIDTDAGLPDAMVQDRERNLELA